MPSRLILFLAALLACCTNAAAADYAYQCINASTDTPALSSLLSSAVSGDTVAATKSCCLESGLTVKRGVSLRLAGSVALHGDFDGVTIENGGALIGSSPAATVTSYYVVGYSHALVLVPSGTANQSYQTFVRGVRLTHSATSVGVGLHLKASGGQVTGVNAADLSISGGGYGLLVEDCDPASAADYANNNKFSAIHISLSRVGVGLIGTATGNIFAAADVQCSAAATDHAVSCQGCNSNTLGVMVWDSHLIADPSHAVEFDVGSANNVWVGPIDGGRVSDAGTKNTFVGRR